MAVKRHFHSTLSIQSADLKGAATKPTFAGELSSRLYFSPAGLVSFVR